MNRNLQKLRDRHKLSLYSQFSLRSLMLLIALWAVCSVLLREVSRRYGLATTLVAVFTGLSVFAHVAGAALGSRLRANSHPRDDLSDFEETDDTIHQQPLAAVESDFAPTTELSHQRPLTLRPIFWAVGIGAVLSSILASLILIWFMWDDLAVVNVVFGALSAAVIGGILGFWVSSFWQVVRSALVDAEREPRKT